MYETKIKHQTGDVFGGGKLKLCHVKIEHLTNMPAFKVRDLYQICLENIIHNVNFWLNVKEKQTSKGNASSPFDSLPACIGQDLLETFEHVHAAQGLIFWLEHQDQWRLFVTRHITRLCITEYTDRTSLIHIAVTCKNVKYLEIKNVQEILLYLRFISPCLATVMSLNFESMAHLTGASLKYIRNHCPNLRNLILKSCFLNDKAVGHLKHISTLMELDLRDTEVSAVGLCHVLKHNPQLCSLKHPDVVRALFKMHSTKTWLLKISPLSYQLKDLEFELSCKDSPNMLAVVAAMCPSIERVRVEFDVRASPLTLAPLNHLQNLTELDIQCLADSIRKSWWDEYPHGAIEAVSLFQGSIVPILKACGKHLLTMCLEGVFDVNMQIVEQYCPHLVTLGLYYNSYVQDSFHVPQNISFVKPFPSLKRLMFGSNSGNKNDFPASYLEWLLANKDLEELSLSGSPLFTKELFTSAFTSSCAFPKLRRLELDYCNISSEIITEFLYHCGRKSLRELSICGPFVHEQAPPALCYIVSEKLDVQLEAYFYSFIKMKKRMVRFKQDLNFH